jgi:hypothetical protein
MYLAEIHGKLSNENENKEDILTSNIFSFFKYADRKIFLWPLLKSWGLEVSADEAVQTEFIFWPTYKEGTQPDLVIISGHYYLLIEAKYHSGFGKETQFKQHQLVREIEGGVYEAKNLGKIFKILIITPDYSSKTESIQEIMLQHRQKLKWINWQKITYLIYSILENDPKITPETRFFAEDLYKLLLKKNLRNFEGVKALNQVRKIPKMPVPIFFLANTASYRGDFIGFLNTLEFFPKITTTPNTLFFRTQKRKIYFSNSMDEKLIVQNAPLFFTRYQKP